MPVCRTVPGILVCGLTSSASSQEVAHIQQAESDAWWMLDGKAQY